MTIFPSHILLHGRRTPVRSILESRTGTSGWEKEWLDFLSEWYTGDDSIVVKTSGSTGKPKTIRLSKEFVAASARRTLHYFRLAEGDRVLHCLPSRYIAGKLMIVRALIGKLDLHVTDPSSDFSMLQEKPFQFSAMVTNQVSKILAGEDGVSRLQHLQKLLIGGGSIPAALREKLRPLATESYSSYGMTETSTHIAIQKINGEGADDDYHCLEGIRVSLSPEGCLRVHVPGLDNEYLQTNDLAELKDNRTFRILGRADHVIISGGMKFSPEQIEQKLEKSIAQPFVISSLPDEKLGQQIVLVVEGNEDPEAIPALNEICRRHLGRYERPRQIRFFAKLPRTPNGKLQRGTIDL
ncbi:MAG: AMP-binding protein [Mangrovibacterium sp.]|nr:AMP-binding protein [Mangrovibacterium sp.]